MPPRMLQPEGSPRGTLSLEDGLNTLKHVVFVAVATTLTPLAQGAPLDWGQLKGSAITAGATGLLTLLARWGQDNR